MNDILLGTGLTLVAVALWGALHSLLAGGRAKSVLGGGRAYRLAYNVVAFLTLLPVLAVPARYPGAELYRIGMPWVLVTSGVQLLAVAAIGITLLQTGLSEFLGLSEDRGGELQVSGFYRWVRHPLYTAGLIIIWLTPVMTTSVLALNIGLTSYIVIGSRFEERALASRFGKRYDRYRDSVPGLIPRPGASPE